MEGKMHLKSIGQAMLAYASDHQGGLPGMIDPPNWGPGDKLPLFEYVNYVSSQGDRLNLDGVNPQPEISAYRSRSDVSVSEYGRYVSTKEGLSSYAVNMMVHLGRPRMSTAFPDGLSNTIYGGEHLTVSMRPYISVNSYGAVQSILTPGPNNVPGDEYPNPRVGVFANKASFDVLPITTTNPLMTFPSVPNVTFQHCPTSQAADSRLLHSTLPQGLLVVMGDGSTKCISSNISVNVFWSLITPAGGENVILFDGD